MKRLEKHIEQDIIQALRTLGFMVTKTSQPRSSMITAGCPDLYASHALWKLRLWIEVKRPGYEPTVNQQLWHLGEIMAGGTVLIARSVADVTTELRRLGAPIT